MGTDPLRDDDEIDSQPETRVTRSTMRPTAPTPREERIPTMVGAVRAPLGPLESFVLGKVDGKRTIADIGALVGLSAFETLRVFDRLVGLVPGLSLRDPQAGDEDDDLLEGAWEDPSAQPTTELQLTREQIEELERRARDD